ncbi:MAG: ABC transporter substrate-binding protein [Desulfobacteraceae bacterium]|nr:ABC transporter substrate-binding protein [Desulfobacteraceae bacterium]
MQQAHQSGIPEYVRFIGGWGFNSPKLFQLAGRDANRAISGSAWNISNIYPASKQFVDDFKEEYGTLPDQFAAQSYTAVLVLAAAIRKANSSDRAEIRDALTKIGEIDSPLGLFSFDKNREPVHEPVVQVMDNGKFVLLK